MNCCATIDEEDLSEFVEVDPSGRYGRYNEILGRGSSKTVYKAFDEYEGIEVAWNQVKLHDFLRNSEDLEKLYREIHLLKTLKHENIMKFYTSWVDTDSLTINFVTELFNSGTLRQYRLKHRRVNIRAVKNWCRQILKGLLYLHSHDPPIIHRDLKCDNIFINGNQGEVKIGDLGLAAVLRKSHAVRCVGTPEFMAPEVYEEEYNELVDIYSFGMCILEMVTFEYPYSECTHPAQIYKKVISRKKPEAFYKVKDPEVRRFIDKCLSAVSSRLPAFELLKDPFMQIDDDGFDLRPVDYYKEYNEAGPFLRQATYGVHRDNALLNGDYEYPTFDDEEGNCFQDQLALQMSEIDLFANQDDESFNDVDISIKGRRQDDDGIFLRLRIADQEGRIRNIYFPFNTKTDTAMSVAAEMVSELDITDQDVAKIADMIDGEISTLVPGWLEEETAQENSGCAENLCQGCASNSLETVSSNCRTAEKRPAGECSKHDFGSSIHGRFEEISYQVDQCVGEDSASQEASQCKNKGLLFADIWAQKENAELLSDASTDDVHQEQNAERNADLVNPKRSKHGSTGYENAIRQELRQLKEKYQLQVMDPRPFNSIDLGSTKSLIPLSLTREDWRNFGYPKRLSSGKDWNLPFSDQSVEDCEGVLPPRPLLHRAVSLPVDAIDV